MIWQISLGTNRELYRTTSTFGTATAGYLLLEGGGSADNPGLGAALIGASTQMRIAEWRRHTAMSNAKHGEKKEKTRTEKKGEREREGGGGRGRGIGVERGGGTSSARG